MGVFKEEVNYLEGLVAQQKRIYSDSIDYGVSATDEIKNQVRETLQALPGATENCPAGKPVWKSEAGNVTQRLYKSRVKWSMEDGVAIGILYVNDRPRKKEYFTIGLLPIHA